MTYTKESIFSRIGDLLVEINDEYTALSDKDNVQSDTALLLLEAKAKFLASHIEVLRKLTETVAEERPLEKNEGFTPPLVLEGETDKQPVYNEIQEVEPIAESELQPENEAVEVEDVHEDVVDGVEDSDSPITDLPVEDIQTDVLPKEEDPVQVAETQEESVTDPAATTEVEEEWPEKEEEELPHPVVEEPKKQIQEELKFESFEHNKTEAVVNEVVEEKEKLQPARPLTLNEILQQQRQAQATVVDSSVPSSPSPSGTDKVVDLKSSISLNDKLLFIKDLFNGYSLAYSEAIELLNRYTTFAEADAFLQTNYALKNNWAEKPQTVEKLYAILRKKFMY